MKWEMGHQRPLPDKAQEPDLEHAHTLVDTTSDRVSPWSHQQPNYRQKTSNNASLDLPLAEDLLLDEPNQIKMIPSTLWCPLPLGSVGFILKKNQMSPIKVFKSFQESQSLQQSNQNHGQQCYHFFTTGTHLAQLLLLPFITPAHKKKTKIPK